MGTLLDCASCLPLPKKLLLDMVTEDPLPAMVPEKPLPDMVTDDPLPDMITDDPLLDVVTVDAVPLQEVRFPRRPQMT